MSLGFRIFLVKDDCSTSRIAVKKFTDFYLQQKPTLSEFCDRTIKVAVIICKLKQRRPTEIIKIDCIRVKVGADGAMDPQFYSENIRLTGRQLDGPFSSGATENRSESSLVDAAEKFDERRWAQLHPELPGPALKQILQSLFG